MKSLEQFQVQGYKTSMPALFFFVLGTDCSQSQQATTQPQAASCGCDLVASDNLYSADTAGPSHQLGCKRMIKSEW